MFQHPFTGGFFAPVALRQQFGNGFDSLTKLPSRATFLKTLAKKCKGAKHSEAALIVMDISEYHNINLSYGEEIGNRVLRQAAERLNSVRRSGDYLARIGDDQFVLLLSGLLGQRHALLAAEKVQKCIGEPFVFDSDKILVQLNMGVALSSQVTGDSSQLFACAVKALYRSKHSGERIVLYDGDDYQAEENGHGVLLFEFCKALKNGKLELEYQAKQELSSGRICGAEALLRWRHPKRGNVQPRVIIELADKAGCVDTLTFWIIDQALRRCSIWLKQGMQIVVSVNLEAGTFYNPQLPALVAEALELWRVEPRFLILEVTESTLMKQHGQVQLNIEKLKSIGVRVSMDDFGTGYSSLEYLNRLDVHELKIDKIFIDNMESSAKGKKLVSAIINLGQSLGLKVTAEGVETSSQYQKLKNMGCDIVQGHYVSRPLPINQFLDTVNNLHERLGGNDE